MGKLLVVAVSVAHHLLLFSFLRPPLATCSYCGDADWKALALAFRSVAGFQAPLRTDSGDCSIKELRLSSRNLSGTVSWMYLRNLTSLRALDLSGNALQGSVPGGFWSSPALVEVNLAGNQLGGALRFQPSMAPSSLRWLDLSGNRFTSVVGLLSFPELELLDLSGNSLGFVPVGLEKLRRLKRLDVSRNAMSGVFPERFPPLADGSALTFLNVSYNNFSGVVKPGLVRKFGRSAFLKAGTVRFASSFPVAASSPSPAFVTAHWSEHRSRKRVTKLGAIAGAVFLLIALIVVCCAVGAVEKRRKKRRGKKEKDLEAKEAKVLSQQEVNWVSEAKSSAPVVMFKKPLMSLTFADLVKATSGFGRESQLAASEGSRSGSAYRAVLPGDMHVVVRVVDLAQEMNEGAAFTPFCEIARLDHPNLLPLLGYCIPGKEKLVLYDYMERGDLHRWLHELPVGEPDVEDWSGDTWEAQQQHGDEKRPPPTAMAISHWPTRHEIALGVARALAFLHQGWTGSARRGAVHGHVVPTNVLLDDNLVPRLSDFGAGEGNPEGDVYDYGLVMMELLTGREGWRASADAAEWARTMVRAGRATEMVDPRLRFAGPAEVSEAAECLRVGCLCTAPAPEKRPSMQQVVALLKDIRHLAAANASSSDTTSSS